MKKICFVVTGITENGISRVLTILLEKMISSDFEITVLFTRNRKQVYEIDKSIQILISEKENWSGVKGKIKNILSIRKIMKREKFDVVISLGNYASMYMLLGSIGIKMKKIISERNDPNSEPNKKIYRRLRNIIYRTANILVCQTDDAKEYYKDIVKKSVVIPNPLKENLPMIKTNERKKRIVNFCRLNEQKNIPLLIDAFCKLHQDYPEYKLDIYGSGELEVKLKDYINEKGLNECVFIYGFCKNIHEIIKDYEMFVSSSDYEGMSNSMLEAMAIGLPTVVTDCPIGGARMVINSYENGILVPVRNCEALYKAMKYVIENPSKSECMSKKAMEIRNTLSADKINQMWIEVINN